MPVSGNLAQYKLLLPEGGRSFDLFSFISLIFRLFHGRLISKAGRYRAV